MYVVCLDDGGYHQINLGKHGNTVDSALSRGALTRLPHALPGETLVTLLTNKCSHTGRCGRSTVVGVCHYLEIAMHRYLYREETQPLKPLDIHCRAFNDVLFLVYNPSGAFLAHCVTLYEFTAKQGRPALLPCSAAQLPHLRRRHP